MSLVSGLLNQKITSIKSVTTDGYGDVTETSLYTDVDCRWQERRQELTDSNNETIISTVEVWLMPSISIDNDYNIVYDSRNYKVVGTEKKYDLDGVHDYTKIYLV